MLINQSGSVAPVQRIPRLLHHVWLGPEPPSAENSAWVDGARAMHPGWNSRMWTEADLPGVWAIDPFGLEPIFAKRFNFGYQSDILRLLILWLFGGIYLDMDVEVLRPLGPLAESADAFIGASYPSQRDPALGVENAILGFGPQHPFLGHVLRRMSSVGGGWASPQDMMMQTVAWTGPAMLTDMLLSWRAFPASLRADVAILPARILFPSSPAEVHALDATPAATLNQESDGTDQDSDGAGRDSCDDRPFIVHHWDWSWWPAADAPLKPDGDRVVDSDGGPPCVPSPLSPHTERHERDTATSPPSDLAPTS